ncbi:LuxR family transcriptional regulator [Actinoplanes sp. NPDC049598]|uniref:helix-turn-helix transcriptional regulator n=1 Tax=Actinoplanes sp. NPDC049598 TaxID=3154626 RepID=UPI00342184C2
MPDVRMIGRPALPDFHHPPVPSASSTSAAGQPVLSALSTSAAGQPVLSALSTSAAGQPVRGASPDLAGNQPVCAVSRVSAGDRTMIAAFLESAASRPMSLAVLGEAGIGKTTLLGELGRLAGERGFRVVDLAPDAPLRTLFAAHAVVSSGPARPHRVLRDFVRTGRLVCSDDEPALVTGMVLALDGLAAAAPVLILIDRADTLDGETRRLLTSLLRHLSTERVSLVLAARGSEPPVDISRYAVPPLTTTTAARLLGPQFTGSRRDALRRAAGNPMVLLAPEISPDHTRTLAELPPVTRRLLYQAALGNGSEPVDALTRSAAGAGLQDWEPAEQANLITITDGRVRFTHPLLRAHLATAAPTPASAAASSAAASSASVSAAAFTGFGAAEALPAIGVLGAYHAGEPAWAVELHRGAPDSGTFERAAAGFALIQLARPVEAWELAQKSIFDGALGGVETMHLAAVAATAVMVSGEAEHFRQLPRVLDRVDNASDETADRAEVAAGWAGPVAAAGAVDPAGRVGRVGGASAGRRRGVEGGLGSAARLLFTGAVAWRWDDSGRAAADLGAVRRIGLREEAPGVVLTALPLLILALMDGGRWAEAAALIEEGEELAAVSGATLLDSFLPAVRRIIGVWRGEGAMPSGSPGDGLVASLHHRAAGLAALAEGEHEDAYGCLRTLFDRDGRARHPVLGPQVLPQLALAAVRTGRVAQARAVVGACRPAGRRTAMLAGHAGALLDGDEEAFRRAAGAGEAGRRWPLEHAEAQLGFAIWLRRQRRLRESRPYFQGALDTFQRLGARAQAELARRYLPGSGVDGPEPGAILAGLPAQKQRIARLAANGLKNIEIARALNVSPRTVSSYLHDIFPRLGVGSRHQLRELLTANRAG